MGQTRTVPRVKSEDFERKLVVTRTTLYTEENDPVFATNDSDLFPRYHNDVVD